MICGWLDGDENKHMHFLWSKKKANWIVFKSNLEFSGAKITKQNMRIPISGNSCLTHNKFYENLTSGNNVIPAFPEISQ